jgi:hypothetical protein
MLLAGLVGVLTVVVAYQFWPSAPAAVAQAPAQPVRTRAERPGGASAARGPSADVVSLEVVNVEMARLQQPLPAPDRTGRDPFRYQARARETAVPPMPVARPVASSGNPGNDGSLSTSPPPPPPPPPITLKFIGLLTAEKGVGRVAVLSDGKYVFYGREGDVIEGRYRVVKIGEESIQMEHVDGRGRQTIRLSGA